MPRPDPDVWFDEIVRATSVLALLAGALTSCGEAPSGRSVTAAPVSATFNLPTGAAVTDDAFRAAAGCSDCTVIARSTVTLPLTGQTFVEAKMRSAAGLPVRAALDLGGRVADGQALLAAEGKTKMARQGKLRDVLYPRSLTSSAELVPVSIWANFGDGHEPRQRIMSDANFRAAYKEQTAARLHAVTNQLTAWLDARGFAVYDRGTDTPLITADVPANVLDQLGRLDSVGVVDLREPEVPNALTWFDTVKGPAAQMIAGSAAGVGFCNGEGTQPYNASYLAISQTLDPTANVSHHMQWTSEIISATSNVSMAPGATFDVPAYYHDSNSLYTEFQAWSWCFSTLGVNNMNVSAGTGQGQIPLKPEDMAKDYYVYHSPYPFITLSAGNCEDSYNYGVDCLTGSPANGTSVDNRAYNGLVVGASETNNTADTSDDSMAYFSQFINPQTTHDDFELPNLVAPGSEVEDNDITSASGISEAGTSASAPIVMGTALLMRTQDTTFNIWPEMLRATILTASTHPVDGTRTTALGGWDDLRQGAGLLNANLAVDLANPAFVTGPNNSATSTGRDGITYEFATDFPNNVSAPYNIAAAVTGRLRVVIAWDATAQFCNPDGSGCQGDVLDGDLDLWIRRYDPSTGTYQTACESTSWDSSWELCDIAVNAGEIYEARLIKNATSSPSTYVGIAWNNYDPNGE